MKVGFVRPDLRYLDEVAGDAVALGVFSDERPLGGVAGLVDWRLNGTLSRWIAAGRFRGEPREVLLYPDRGRLSFGRVVLFGLGPRAAYDEDRHRTLVPQFLRVLRDMGVARFAAQVPGRRALTMNVRQLVDHWLAAVRDVFCEEARVPSDPDVLIIEDADTQRATAETVQQFLRRVAPRGR